MLYTSQTSFSTFYRFTQVGVSFSPPSPPSHTLSVLLYMLQALLQIYRYSGRSQTPSHARTHARTHAHLIVLPFVLVKNPIVIEQRGDGWVVGHQRAVVRVKSHFIELGCLCDVPVCDSQELMSRISRKARVP